MELLPGNLQFVLNTMALTWTAGLNGSLLQLSRTKNTQKMQKLFVSKWHTSLRESNMNPEICDPVSTVNSFTSNRPGKIYDDG